MNRWYCIIIGLIPALLSAKSLVVNQTFEKEEIGLLLEMFVDSGAKIGVEQVQSENLDWQTITVQTPQFWNSNAAHWFRFTITNHQSKELFLELAWPFLEEVDFYQPDGAGGYQEFKTGAARPFTDRPIDSNHYLFPLHFYTEGPTTFYLRTFYESDMRVPLTVLTARALIEKKTRENMFHGLYFGTMLVMVLYNLFLFFSAIHIALIKIIFSVIMHLLQ